MRIYTYTILLMLLLLHAVGFSQTTSHLVYFESNAFIMSDMERQRLHDYIETFQNDPMVEVKLMLIGRTDSIGSMDDNVILAEKRLRLVKEYLKENQQMAIIQEKNAGELLPLQSNNTESGRKQNRSVEIIDDVTIRSPILRAIDTTTSTPIVYIPMTTPDTITAPAPPPTSSETFQVLKKGKKIRLKNIGFIPGSVRVNAESAAELNELLWVMHNHPTLRIEIRGHVCCKNDRRMSVGRARTVKDYLVANGVNKSNIEIRGFSNRRPVSMGLTQKGKQRNRRVEIKILEI